MKTADKTKRPARNTRKPVAPKQYNRAGIEIQGEREPRTRVFPKGERDA
ncbi:hypothetical protein [Sporosarcina aquimarina]|uniref:Uncharacterized protein n=1 Tax=Sporosarcina aquimarina TaxID=114975 RepID=A0ABU4G462_9BACL|nr:hypothetical protein [Sporosarcina aquimarina]MDW0110452.1 hypothetical protein [Sporosarcina aquimarina]